MIHQGGYPGLPDRVTLSAGVKFCYVNVSRWGNPPSRGRIRDTSNSRKHSLWQWLCIIIKGKNRMLQHWRLQQEQQVSVEEHWCQNAWFASIFLVYKPSDHSIILRKYTPGWRGCKSTCKGRLFFLPHLSGLPHLPAVPHLHVNRPYQSKFQCSRDALL